MHDKLQKVSMASSIIESYYVKLRELTINSQEDSLEYADIINKLRKMVATENNIYEELTEEEIDAAIDCFKNNGIKTVIDERIYTKLKEYKVKCNHMLAHTELGLIISAKIMIDVLKTLTYKLLRLSETDISQEDIEAIFIYNDLYKFNHLTANTYLEKIALEYNFDILSIPSIEFNDIDKSFSFNVVEDANELFLSYIISTINELLDIKNEDKLQMIYLTLFEVSRIEVMLPYLNKLELVKLSNYLSNLNINNSVINKIKKLVIKRKEELN